MLAEHISKEKHSLLFRQTKHGVSYLKYVRHSGYKSGWLCTQTASASASASRGTEKRKSYLLCCCCCCCLPCV
jgi:hypothetical protein